LRIVKGDVSRLMGGEEEGTEGGGGGGRKGHLAKWKPKTKTKNPKDIGRHWHRLGHRHEPCQSFVNGSLSKARLTSRLSILANKNG